MIHRVSVVERPPPIDSEEAALLYCDEVLDGDGHYMHLDKVGSVSGPIRFDLVTDPLRRRALVLSRAPQVVSPKEVP